MKQEAKKDDIARIGWMYYIAGNTQDEIALKFGISRQSVQRMTALALKSKLIKVRLDHPIMKCLELEELLKKTYGLLDCQIAPSDTKNPNLLNGVAGVMASILERYLSSSKPKNIAFGTGRALLAAINEVKTMNCPQHKLLSLVGNMTDSGIATSYEVTRKIADKIKTTHYPMPLTVLAKNKQQKDLLYELNSMQNILNLANQIDVAFVGIGHIDIDSPLIKDGFINENELKELIEKKAVGEIIGWIFNNDGDLVNHNVNQRVTSVPLFKNSKKPIYVIGVGDEKKQAILSAIKGKLINSLITDELTAKWLIEQQYN